MADNANLTEGDGTIIAGADDIGGVKYPRVKANWGPDGTINDTDVASGKPFPVQVRSATGLIPVGEPTDAKSTATDGTSTSIVSILKQVSASIQLLVFGAGTATAAQRVTLASNDPLVAAFAPTAADGALSANPLTTGGRATSTNLAKMSADGDVVNATHTMQGAVVVADGPRELLARQATTITSSTAETTIVTAGAAGIFNDLYGLVLANTSATATKVTVRDATGAGTASVFYVPAGDTRGFMLSAGSAIPGTVADNWTATCGTSVASLEVTALYIKRK